MMQDVSIEKANKEPRTIEIGQTSSEMNLSPPPSSGNNVVDSHSNFGPDLSGSDIDEASEVDSFALDENDIEESDQGAVPSKFLLAAEAEGQGIQTVDPQTHARLEALLEAAGINKQSKDGKHLSDPGVLSTLSSSVSSALNEAAQALHRMRDSQGQIVGPDSVPMEAGSETDPMGHRPGSGSAADATEEGESLLSLACSAGYYELAQVLLAMKANVEDRGIKGDCTPLMEAASGGHVDIVKLLLLHRADIHAQSRAGNTPLHYGACGGYKEVVQELMLHGANVEIHNENGHTPLMEAASAGHVDVAKILLEHGAGINTHSNEFKESALTLACYKGHLDMVKFLLEAGADQEHKTDEMHTALMEASMDGHVEVARLLLDSGAQVNMPADSFESPLTLAACGGHIELASLLIERGANIEEVNDEGYTPLMEAAREGHEDMVALLLSQDADINAQTEETQETALTLACCGGFLDVADFLLRSGALIERGCSTPLMEAAQEGHLELVSFLLKSGANVEAQTGTGDTALTYACENGHTDVAEALLECGAKLEHESEGGRTPLMKAARAGHLCTVQFLISKGADVNRATTSNDQTVLSLACGGGHLAVVELLLQHNSDANHKLKDGSTMVIEAAKGGHTQVVKLLLEWPNRFLVNSTQDQLAQLTVADAPCDEPRVPVQGLANIVPPSEPDSQIPLATATLASALQGKTSDLIRQSMQKPLAKRTGIAQPDPKAGNKFCAPSIENFQPFLNADGSLIDEKSIEAEEKLLASAAGVAGQQVTKEQLARHQQVQQMLIQTQHVQAKQTEELVKLLDPPSQPLCMADSINHQFNNFAKLLANGEFGSASNTCPEEYFQHVTVQAHLHQQQQQQQLAQLSSGISPPPVSSPTPSPQPIDPRGTATGKNQGGKRAGPGKAARGAKSGGGGLQQPPPPPPPPPTGMHPVKGPLLLPLANQQQALLSQGLSQGLTPGLATPQPIVFQAEHNGGAAQLVDGSGVVGVSQPAMQVLSQPVTAQQQQQLLAYPQLLPQQHEQLLQHMLSQPSLQHQLQMQHISQQVQSGQLQGVSPGQVAAPPRLTQQEQQIFQQQQQQAHQLLQQQLQPLKVPPAAPNHTIAINKPQVVRKQQRLVQTTTQTVLHQNSMVTVDGSLPHVPAVPTVPNVGVPAPGAYSGNVDVDSQTESTHDTALTLACAGGHAELVSLLLAKGADIEHRDKKFFTPLILSATAGHVEVVEILLDHGADIEAQSERTKDTALSLACSGGRYEVVELLLSRNANKEHRNVSDYTPLSLAASGGYVAIIKLLLSQSAEINSRTGSKLGISPLMLAAMNGHTAAVKLLLDMGSDINAQIETNRNTALTLACFQGRHEVVSLLVDRKANIEHRAKTGLTPLMEAASGGYVEVGRVLLDKGADVNAPPVPSSRDTALTIAADKGHYRFVELLLHRGASVDVKNKKGNSPLWLACNGGHSDVVSLLVQADADIDSQDNRKVSCLMAAFRRGHIKVVKWMVKKVTQFPSENEIKRYIATITDKELQKKCNQCADVIVAAKDRQAAEANKNADSLLEEIKQEKEQAALKAEMASKRRERRRERKKKGKPKDDKTDKDSGKNSSPEPDGESNKKDDDEEDEDDDESNPEPPVILSKSLKENKAPRGKQVPVAVVAPSPQTSDASGRLPSSVPPSVNPLPVSVPAAQSSSALGGAAAARANREARKKQQKAARENRAGASDQDAGLRHVKVTMTSLMESVVTVSPASSALLTAPSPSSSKPLVSSQPHHHSEGPVNSSHTSTQSSTSTAVNGGGNKTRAKKSDIIKHSSSTGIGDLDDFGVIPSVIKNIEKINGKTSVLKKLNASDNKKDWVPEVALFEKSPSMSNRLTTVRSPRKWQGKEEGWKEVVRKNVSKKLTVPGNVISRLIGKGGCNINKIREISGAHVEVEKSKGNSDRTVTIKGYPEAIRQANNLINAMVDDPEKDVAELLARASKANQANQANSAGSQKTVQPAEKPVVPKPAPTPAITDFAIGTFSVPSSSSGKSPGQTKSGRASRPPSNPSNSNVLSGSIGAWQNPVPGQAVPASPRRSPMKQVTPSAGSRPPTQPNPSPALPTPDNKTSARQLVFATDRSSKRLSPPAAAPPSSASLSFTTAATSTVRGSLPSSGILVAPTKPIQPPGSAPAPRYTRPVAPPAPTPLPLPIVTSGVTAPAAPAPAPPGEYSPFNPTLFSNFLSKKEESSDKMDFASVAAAGVVQQSSPPSAPSPAAPSIDPALQAKAPGYKAPPGPPGPLQVEPAYHTQIPSQLPSQLPLQSAPSAVRPQGLPPFMDSEMMARYQQRMLAHSMAMREQSMFPQHHQFPFGIPTQQQKDEYSKPHRPMTLPEIKGALNPNAPEFQLPGSVGPMMNGLDRQMHLLGHIGADGRPTMPNMANLSSMPLPLSQHLEAHSGPSPNVSPNPGTLNTAPGSMPAMMQQQQPPTELQMQYLLQQVRPQHPSHPDHVSHMAGRGGPPPQHMAFLSQSQGHQGRPHSPLQGHLPANRPNSAPSVHPDAAMMGPRSGSPLAARASPPEQTKHIQPIGGERKKGPTRHAPPPMPGANFGNPWGYNHTGYPPRMSESEGEGLDYGLQQTQQLSDNSALMPGGDADHRPIGGHTSNLMVDGIYGNGTFPMGPMFQPKGAGGDSLNQPLWSSAMTSAPSHPNDTERWQSWNQ